MSLPPLVVPIRKVTHVSSPIIITNPILDDNSRICEDFPPGFEGQGAEKGKFARQLQEIDEDLAKFEDMEGINTSATSLPYKDSNTSIPSDFEEKYVTPNTLFSATRDLSAPIIESMSEGIDVLEDRKAHV